LSQPQDAPTRDAENKRKRVALARRPISDKPCEVPACEGAALVDEDDDETDCCYGHSLQSSDTENTLPNDGIIDWTAIEVAVQGTRPVSLTWVEKDIAIAMILARGGTITQACERVGADHKSASKGSRAEAIARILSAQSTRKGGL
jgi:hypothetical protein